MVASSMYRDNLVEEIILQTKLHYSLLE